MRQLYFRLIFVFVLVSFVWFLFHIFYENMGELYSLDKLKEMLYYSFIKAFLLTLFLGVLNYFDLKRKNRNK